MDGSGSSYVDNNAWDPQNFHGIKQEELTNSSSDSYNGSVITAAGPVEPIMATGPIVSAGSIVSAGAGVTAGPIINAGPGNEMPKQELEAGSYDSYSGTSVTAGPAESIKSEFTDSPDFVEMQRLSQNYQPDLQGPLIGAQKPMKDLAREYAGADPTYVRKTKNLAAKYEAYRPVRGDGSCGWRALAFCFFEHLLKLNDPNRFGMEHARVRSLNGLMESVGFASYIYEDFADSTFEVFSGLTSGAINSTAGLLETFNQPSFSDSIVAHMKLLTSAWLKRNTETYQPFLDVSIGEHCATHVEPFGVEIENVGLMALIECLVLPADMAVEVYYLDRSTGEEVNIHRFTRPVDSADPTPANAPVLRLLYRPGHYDILYKKRDLPVPTLPAFSVPPPQPQNLQVAFVHSLPDTVFQATPVTFNNFPFFYSLPASAYQIPAPVVSAPPPAPPPTLDQLLNLDEESATDSDSSSYNFRQSPLSIPEFQPSLFQPLPFQTSTFRNSPFNPSHFQSENFQPEIYRPELEAMQQPKKRSDRSD